MKFENEQGNNYNVYNVEESDDFWPVADADDNGMQMPQQRYVRTPVATDSKFLKIPFAVILAVAVVVSLVIAFAFYWEATQEVEPEIIIEDPPNYPPRGRSEIQDQLLELDWVDKDFLPINDFSRPGELLGDINGIVIHFIGNPDTTAEQNRNYFANLAETQDTYASSNFIVCLDGRIVQCVPVDELAYASHHRNNDTLSIELCHPDETGEFTEETYDSAVRLTAWLCEQYGLSADDVIRHFDIVRSDGSQKECPLYFVENENAWEEFKDAVTLVRE